MGRSGARAEGLAGSPPRPAAMDPFLVLLHSVSTGLSNDELTELKFLCRSRVGKRKLERVQSGLDLFNVLLEQNELDSEHTELLRELLVSLRRQDLLQRLDGFEAGAAGRVPPEERGGRGAPGTGAGPGRLGTDRARGRRGRFAQRSMWPVSSASPFSGSICADFVSALLGDR